MGGVPLPVPGAHAWPGTEAWLGAGAGRLGTVVVTPEPPETATGAMTAVVTAVLQAWLELEAGALECDPLTDAGG